MVGASMVARDITERKRAEAALRDSEQRYRTLIDLGPVAVYACDAAGVITQFNRRAAELWGREPAPGDTSEVFCGSYKMFRPDGSLLPHERCPTAEAVRGQVTEVRDGEVYIGRPDGSRVAVVVNIRALRNSRGETVGAINCFYDITERKQAEVRQRLLMDELNHRVKNTLAAVQSIAAQTMIDEADPAAFRSAFDWRLAALSRTHNLLSQNQWLGSALRDVLIAETTPYVDGHAGRLAIDGPPLDLTPSAALAIGMAFHELATNAEKYGAFSVPAGRVRVTWAVTKEHGEPILRLEWRESEGPRVEPPKRRGVGFRLIEEGLAHQLDGEAKLRFEPGGVRFVLEAPLPSIEVRHE